MPSTAAQPVPLRALLFAAIVCSSAVFPPDADAAHRTARRPRFPRGSHRHSSGTQLAQARTAFQAGKFAPAEALLRSYLALRPHDEEARFLLARALTFQNRGEAALAEYAALLRRHPNSADYLLGRAQALQRSGRLEPALASLRRARALAPQYADVYRVELEVLSRLGREAEARQLASAASRRFPGERWAALPPPAPAGRGVPAAPGRTPAQLPVPPQLEAARMAIAEQRYADAEQLLAARLAAHPQDSEARFLLARVFSWQNKTAEAAAEYDRLLAGAPRNVDYLVGKAQALIWGERAAEALPLLAQARAVNPRYEDVYRLQAQALRKTGDETQLAALLREAARLFPAADWIVAPAAPDGRLLQQARTAVAESRFSEAEALLRQWLARNPSDEPGRFLLARVLTWQNKTAEASAEYDRLLSGAPRSLDYLLGKAQVLVAAGTPVEALPLLRQAKELSPRYEEIYRLEVQALRRLGDEPRLQQALAEAGRLFPGREWLTVPVARDTRLLDQARVALDMVQLAQGERLLREWLAQNPDDAEARARLARVLTWQGKTDAALAEYDRLLKAAPNNVDLLVAQSQALLRSGRAAQAVPPLERARSLSPQYEDVYRLLLQALSQTSDRARFENARAEAVRRFPGSEWPEVVVRPLPAVTTTPVRPTEEDLARWAAIQRAIDADQLPEAERLAREWLARYRLDDNARLLLARILMWQDRLDEAGREIDAMFARSPNDPDVLLGRAQYLVRRQRPAEALPYLEKARTLAPEYQDIYRLELQALRLAGQRERADALQSEATRRFPDAPWLKPGYREPQSPGARNTERGPAAPTAAPAERSPEAALGFSRDFLDSGYRDWREFSVSISQPLGERRSVYGAFRDTRRFGLHDTEISAGYNTPLGRRLGLNMEASGSPTSRVLPVYSVAAGLTWSLGGGWNLLPAVRRTEYSRTASNRGSLGVERYFGPFRAMYLFGYGSTEGVGDTMGHRATLSYYYGERSAVTLGAALGEEIESLGPARVLRTDVFGLSLYGRHWFRRTWALDWGLGWTRQGDLYHRTGISVGLRHVF